MWKLEAFYKPFRLIEFLNENNIQPSDAKITFVSEYNQYVLFYYVSVKNDEKSCKSL